MIEFFVAGEWCRVDFWAERQAPILQERRDGYWENLEWMPLGLLGVRHPSGTVYIVPKYHPWRWVKP